MSGTGCVGQAAVGVSGRGGFNHSVDCECHFGRSGSQHGSQEKSALKIDNLAIIKLIATQNALNVRVAQPKFTVSLLDLSPSPFAFHFDSGTDAADVWECLVFLLVKLMTFPKNIKVSSVKN